MIFLTIMIIRMAQVVQLGRSIGKEWGGNPVKPLMASSIMGPVVI